MVLVEFGYRYYLPLLVYAYPLSLRLPVLSSLVLGSFSLPLVYLACSPYPDFIFTLKPPHAPASMPMLYSLTFRRLALTLLILDAGTHLLIIIASPMGLESSRPPRSLMPSEDIVSPRFCVTNKPAYS